MSQAQADPAASRSQARVGLLQPPVPIEVIPVENPDNFFSRITERRARETRPSIVDQIPFLLPKRREFNMAAAPDIVVLCHSPRYTPPSADSLFRSIEELLVPLGG